MNMAVQNLRFAGDYHFAPNNGPQDRQFESALEQQEDFIFEALHPKALVIMANAEPPTGKYRLSLSDMNVTNPDKRLKSELYSEPGETPASFVRRFLQQAYKLMPNAGCDDKELLGSIQDSDDDSNKPGNGASLHVSA